MNEPYRDTQITFDIDTMINEARPGSILGIGEGAGDYARNYLAQRQILKQPCTVTTFSADTALARLTPSHRYDLGIVANTLEYLDKDLSGQLIARLRDLHTSRFVVVVRVGHDWDDLATVWNNNEMLGLGMKLLSRYEDEGRQVHVYKYDILSYKKTPEWLNPHDWANPELWDKYRW